MQPFELGLTQGSLLINGAAESYALTTPTTIKGDHDTGDVVDGVAPTGAVTNGTLTTPVISFETVALNLPVFVDATLTQVTPGAGTGVIDADGNVQFRTSMKVRLDIEVPSANLRARCETSPVELVLDSTAPYNASTKRVTLRDADFSVPSVPVTDDCIKIVADNVNDLLAGGGHGLTMTFGGDLVLPPKADCPTETELTVSPVDEARFGTEVTLTGTVARDPAGIGTDDCEGVEDDAIPTGLIEFRDGNRVVGTGEVDPLTGVATFTTDDLPAGTLDLSAAYRSSPPFEGSASAAVPYRVTADPAITADLPSFLRIGPTPTEFDVTVTNSPLGAGIANGRLTLTVAAPSSASNLKVEYREDNGTWTPVPVTSGTTVFARVDPLVGRAIPKGAEVTRRVRVAAPAPSGAGPYQFIFELVEVDPGTGLPAPQRGRVVDADPVTPGLLGAARGEVAVVGATRLTPTWSALGGVQPHTIRQGQTVRVQEVGPASLTIGEIFPTGAVRVLFDGQPVPVRQDTTPTSFGYLPFIDKQEPNAVSPEFVVPVDAPLGDRVVTVAYEGDRFFAPAQVSFTVRVLAARGATYTCASSLLSADRFTVNVEASAILPSAGRSGDEVDLGALDVSLFADRGGSFPSLSVALAPTNPVGVSMGFVTVQEIAMELAGGQGSGTAGAFTTANTFPMFDFTRPEDPAPDAVFGFNDEVGSVTLQGAPGEEFPVTLDRVRVTGTAFLSSVVELDCVPLGDPVTLGTVKLAGAALTVDAPQPTRVGDPVTLTAQVHPIGATGLVEFFAGADSLGLVAVDSLGLASLQTDELPQGTHQLSARFFGGVSALSSTTETVELTVLVATECAAFAEDGSGAVVRLVYMELLGRCPDQAGFDYWVDRLDDGTSAEAFAKAIARTPEAVGKVVDDAYDTMLGRTPDAAGRAFWVKRLQASGRYDALLADLGASGEFWSKAGSTNTGFVTRVYERLLNRAPDQGGLDHWVGRLEDGTSRRALILTLANLNEPLGRLVALSYDEILSRAPNATERTSGIAHLRSTGDRSALYAQLMGRSEFDERAQEFPNPED